MVSPRQWRQLIALVVVATAALCTVGVRYVHLDHLLGSGQYTVHADFTDSGGIFTNAEVTYQGVAIGRVGQLHLASNGVRVELMLDSDSPRVPTTAQAVVANRSAIGEQFVDLRPATVTGPYLHAGSVITDTTVPIPVEDVVSSAITLSDSIPVDDLHTVVTELGNAFDGRGENLRSLVNSLSKLAASGHDNLPATISLLRNADTVLGTQADQSDAILDWSKSLGLITTQLASSDPSIRRLLTSGTASATQISALLTRSGGDATTVVRNLATDVRNMKGTFYGVSPALSMLSLVSAASHSTIYSPRFDGTIRFNLVAEVNNPASCTVGYESTRAEIAAMKKKNPSFDINYDDFPFNTRAHCGVGQGSPVAVRGGQNAKFADPNTAQPWDRIAKKDPDKLNLNPLATQIAQLLGVHTP
ncbi:MCE family protein [Williamsia maris]|uniref:Phospholipid/cholesterol/gamma-HCH transport system substrate-binding protein n=1 Tax=Williamsia maris TaxID=72806 RepID=A0ABT1HJG6_9NOCA|nr:MCE family protein [Williamsia maris]MCP2178073.1 phospholipid/cholesterol/gamma-HCH transport system substrate-binding protein [Williamsia maris]